MELREDDKKMILAINSNNIEEICKQFCGDNFNINIFGEENIHLFDKNAIYLSFFRGCYYYYCYNDIKTKKLMKYNNSFIFLFHHLGYVYYYSKKYNKAIYYLKRKKYNDFYHSRAVDRLYNSCDKLNKKIKSIYYLLKSEYMVENKIYYIFFILNKK